MPDFVFRVIPWYWQQDSQNNRDAHHHFPPRSPSPLCSDTMTLFERSTSRVLSIVPSSSTRYHVKILALILALSVYSNSIRERTGLYNTGKLFFTLPNLRGIIFSTRPPSESSLSLMIFMRIRGDRRWQSPPRASRGIITYSSASTCFHVVFFCFRLFQMHVFPN